MKKIGKLLIISHTEHYRATDGTIVGWGPTIREINHLLDVFDEIWHIAVLLDGVAPKSSIAYSSDRIHFVPIKPFGGRGIMAKLGILLHIPSVFSTVLRTIKKVDFWQLRAPTGIGVFLIPLLSIFIKKPGWFKYAGNWIQEQPPLGYRFQRYWLAKLQKRTVTINGRWPGQPPHCLSFENPCLDELERREGHEAMLRKMYKPPYEICFIGRVEPEKGILRLIHALNSNSLAQYVQTVHVVGDGPAMDQVRKEADSAQIVYSIHGALNREELGKILGKCHFNILPSTASEGFPKVIAEGAAYGCIPIVTDISSIAQYVEHMSNGCLLDAKLLTPDYLSDCIAEFFVNHNLEKMATKASVLSVKFTFEYYNRRIEQICIGAKRTD